MLAPAIRSKTLQSNDKISSTSLKIMLDLIYENKSDNQKERKKSREKKSQEKKIGSLEKLTERQLSSRTSRFQKSACEFPTIKKSDPSNYNDKFPNQLFLPIYFDMAAARDYAGSKSFFFLLKTCAIKPRNALGFGRGGRRTSSWRLPATCCCSA